MNTFRKAIGATVFATTACLSGMAGAASNVQLLVNGLAAPNGAPPPNTQAFSTWCNGVCFPTTHQSAQDPSTRKTKGAIYVWGKNFQFGAGGSVCFSEFIVFALDQGELHVASGDAGTCGAPIDPTLKPPSHGALVVLAGGGDGAIVGGTGKYATWSGTYTDRVFVGLGAPGDGVGGIVYYDQLWFSISAK